MSEAQRDADRRTQVLRARLTQDLEAFLRYRHRIPAKHPPMRENWDARGPIVWMVFLVNGGEVRYNAPIDDFDEWRFAA